MPKRISARDFGATPGQMYKNITALGETFDGSEEKIGVEKPDWYVLYCRKMHKRFPGFGKNAKISKKQEDAIQFLGWRMTPGDLMAGVKGTFVIGIIPVIILLAFMYVFGIGIDMGGGSNIADIIGGPIITNSISDSNMAMMMYLMIAAIAMGMVGAITYYIYSYPIAAGKQEENKALTYVPEMIGYLIMSMKLVPNLEKAIEFAAKHGRGKIALDFKRLIWDFQLGVYSSISEGMDALAYRWGDYSVELKESLMKIRASVMEPSESHRYQLLDKTMLEVLDAVKGKMEDYARGLNQPAVMLFYLGVLLPLILIIILPVGSAFSGSQLATPPLLIGIYCIGIPAAAYIFARKVVNQRPPTYEPPEIVDSFMGLPKKWSIPMKKGAIDARIVFIIILAIGYFLSFGISTQGLPPKFLMPVDEDGFSFQIIAPDVTLEERAVEEGNPSDFYGKKFIPVYFIDEYDITQGSFYKEQLDDGKTETQAYRIALAKKIDFTSNPKNDPTKYLFWGGAIITTILGIAFLLHYRNIYKRKEQLKVIKMEDEFKESMYVIASRMGENKPVESALKQARDFLPNLVISERIFSKTIENIELMGLPLEGAIFDPVYGAMKGIPSKVLNTSMRLLVDSVSLGVEVASRTLMSLSLQLENMDKVNKSLRDMVSDVSTTMQTMAIFIGPIVLGITVALQKVVMMTLAKVVVDPSIEEAANVGDQIGQLTGQSTFSINQLFQIKVDTFQSFASPLMFLIIIAIYVVEIVIVMIYFTSKVQEDNNLLFKINLARALPIAVTIFVVTALAANMMIVALM